MEKIWIQINGVWRECETIMENGVMKVVKATPITPKKRHQDSFKLTQKKKKLTQKKKK